MAIIAARFSAVTAPAAVMTKAKAIYQKNLPKN